MPRRPSAAAKISPPTGQPCQMVKDLGDPDHSRRLSDKVLAAFNHAYSVGETEVAADLRGILAKLEKRGGPGNGRQRVVSATEQADLWIEFVAARNAYTAMLEREQNGEDKLGAALKRMKDCYLRWSHG